jgi:hypothetical protein
MEAAHSIPSVLVLAKDPEHLARLEEANKLLEEIQKVRWHLAPTSPAGHPSHSSCLGATACVCGSAGAAAPQGTPAIQRCPLVMRGELCVGCGQVGFE